MQFKIRHGQSSEDRFGLAWQPEFVHICGTPVAPVTKYEGATTGALKCRRAIDGAKLAPYCEGLYRYPSILGNTEFCLIPFSLFPSHAFLHGGLDAGALPTMEFSLPNVDQCHLKGQLWSEWSNFTSIVLVLGSRGSHSLLLL